MTIEKKAKREQKRMEELYQRTMLNNIYEKLKTFISETVPPADLIREFNGNFQYKIPLEGVDLENLFLMLEEQRDELGIEDWGISQCTLEDVFTHIVENWSWLWFKTESLIIS